jgi:hypothetical protein
VRNNDYTPFKLSNGIGQSINRSHVQVVTSMSIRKEVSMV